jgi:endonuclease YncB( thermonuclease family)
MKLSKRRLKTLLAALLSLLVVALANEFPRSTYQHIAEYRPGQYRVTQIHDGDTISVDMNGAEEKIRLIGVDTPETHDPRKPVQCFGQAASEFTKQLIGDQLVRLELDAESSNRDRYDRLLRYVYLPDNTLVNSRLIQEGYGFALTGFPFSKLEEFKEYEAEARASSKGLWGSCHPSLNSYGSFTSNDEH